MIEIWEVVNYESVSKMLNLLYSQNPHSFSPLFHPNSASNHPQFSLTLSCVSLSSPMRTIKDEHAGEEGRKLMIGVKADI